MLLTGFVRFTQLKRPHDLFWCVSPKKYNNAIKEKETKDVSYSDLQYKPSGRDVVSSSSSLVHLSAHQHRSHANLVAVLIPAGNGSRFLERNSLTSFLPANGERFVHDQPRFTEIDVWRAADVSVGGQRCFGCGRHGVLPLGAVFDDDGLESQRVDVKACERPTRPGLLVALVYQAVEFSHLVQHCSYAWVGVRKHGQVAATEKAQDIGQLLLVHAQRVGVRKNKL